MKTWLYLTPEGLGTPSTEWPCCLWLATGQRQLLPLNQVAQALDGQVVNLLLPMELCSWLRTEPWPSGRRPDTQAIAFAVEEQLGEALERLHLSVGARDSRGCYPVMVIDRARFATVLALVHEASVKVRSAFVDADLLRHDQGLGCRWFGRWMLGGEMDARLTLTDDGLALIKSVMPLEMQWRDERQSDIDQWLLETPARAINLLCGEFAFRRERLPWRLGAMVVLLLILSSWGASEWRIHFLEKETRQLYTQNEQRFKTLYPDQSRIVDLATQLKALQNQGAQPQSTRIATLITVIEQVIGASQVEVQRIEFREGSGWVFQLTANSFAELEQLRERGRRKDTLIKIEGARKERDQVQATLIIEKDT